MAQSVSSISAGRLETYLTTPAVKRASPPVLFWLGLSLIFSIGYALLALRQALSGPYVVQDDARQHVFWMERFLDPGLFPNDLIADYFQSVAPWGYTGLYWVAALVGIDPLFFAKLLPIAVGLVTTTYTFGLSMRLLPVPAAGFVASLLLNQSLWAKDDLVSATPRAFLYPLLIMFLYYRARGSLIPCLLAIALQGLFYPTTLFLSVGILGVRLFEWRDRRPRLSSNRREYLFFGAGLAVATLVMLLFASRTAAFGPVVTLGQAKAMPEFFPGGRVAFFEDSAWEFWVLGKRAGLRPYSIFSPRIVLIGLLFPLLFYWPRAQLRREVTREIRLLPQIVLVSLGMFVAAHLFLFRLHLPGRYTQHSLRIVMALLAGLSIMLLADVLFRWAGGPSIPRRPKRIIAVGVLVLVGGGLLLAPKFERDFPSTRYVVGNAPALYEFFSRQPKGTLIASLSLEANNIPSFSRRSILVGSEYALPYHLGYYREIRRRAIDLINTQYSTDLDEVRAFIQKYGVNFFMVDRDAWSPTYLEDPDGWLRQFQPATAEAVARLARGVRPALLQVMPRCSVFEVGRLVVIDAKCAGGEKG